MTWNVEIAAFVMSVLALLVAGASAKYTRQQARFADEAVTEARRAADAAERSAAVEEELLNRYVVPWRLAFVSGDMYELVNGGDEDAVDVRVDFGGLRMARGQTELPVIHARSRATFLVARTLAQYNATVTVRWRRPGEPDVDREWQHPMPAQT